MQRQEIVPTHSEIVAQLLTLADGWKELLGAPQAPAKKRRAPAKRAKAKA